MAITRLPIVDDTGDGMSGTAITAAWWTTVENMIDGRWSTYASGPIGGGTINDYDPFESDVVLLGHTAPLTINGIVAPANPAKMGKTIRLISANQPITLVHVSSACAPANRLILQASGANVTINPIGSATFQYVNFPALGPVWWLVGTTAATF